MNEQTATYCPEDNKLRLYVGRVPRDEYEVLRKQGWTSTPKQACDFVAAWSVAREDTALDYSGGIIEDEDQSPQERAADRAERFGGYRDKRADEATEQADSYDGGPRLHGYQNAALAERRARQHDRLAVRSVNQWEKAEYWQQRTAGVIGHALHVSAPGVRMGRIKTLEADQRGAEQAVKEYANRWAQWKKIEGMTDPKQARAAAVNMANYFSTGYHYKHPRPESGNDYSNEHGTSLYHLLTDERDPITGAEACTLWFRGMIDPNSPAWDQSNDARRARHLGLRLAYENQMIEAQGGRLAAVDIEPGGWLGNKQIMKASKSIKTGRVVSVVVKVARIKEWHYQTENVPGKDYALMTIKTERLEPGAYRPPTDAEREAFSAEKKAEKDARGVVSTINPTREDAERLQSKLNTDAAEQDKGKNYPRKPGEVVEMTQATYSGSCKEHRSIWELAGGACKIRVRSCGWSLVASVVILTDKPRKAFPAAVFEKSAPKEEERAAV